MMNKSFVPITEVSTDQVLPDQRVAFWESYNASALIGLRCSAFAQQGLKARARSFDLGTVRITDICGNEHVVERNAPMLRTYPKDSIFACLLLEGGGFFYQSGQCVPIHPGDVLVYSTDIPYLYGFTRDSRQLIVEADAGRLLGACPAHRPRAPVKLDAQLRSGRLLARALCSTAVDFVENPYAEKAADVAAKAQSLLRVLLVASAPGKRGEWPDAALWKLLRAEMFIAEHLADPDLSALLIARGMNISVRHLNRLFAARQSSVTQWIWSQRLARAEEDLVSPRSRSVPIGEVAYRWAFANQAHFSRSFKARYGSTPTEYRRRAVAAKP
jgi:AraC-like DNA-binding protein